MHEASARVAGATLAAAEAVWSGRAEHAFNPAGGLHHAMPERASGFCVYDDPAVAIAVAAGRTAPRGSPTWTWTCITATGRRRSSSTIRAC